MRTGADEDLASMLSYKLATIISDFKMKVGRVDDFEAVLVADEYSLLFSFDREGVDVKYVDTSLNGDLLVYTLRSVVMERFTADDRAHYGKPQTMNERILASLSVYSSGLSNTCRDVLAGDKGWLKRDRWLVGSPSAAVASAIHKLRS
jgi:hypothetical protein